MGKLIFHLNKWPGIAETTKEGSESLKNINMENMKEVY